MKRKFSWHIIQTRLGFFGLLVVLFWAKTIFGYYTDFSLGVDGFFQHIILWINPIAISLLLFGLALYIKRPRIAYWTMFGIYIANTALLYFNIIYYREFTDFMTINTILGYSKVSQGLSGSSLALTSPHDILYWLDIIILLILIILKKIRFEKKALAPKRALAVTSIALLIFGINLSLGEMDRPQLLTRTFDRNYIVKYLGIGPFTVYDAFKTAQNNQVRAQADSSDMDSVLTFINQHYAAPNPSYEGVAKGKNIIIIHLESFQQFIIDMKVDGQEVTPFLNSLYHSNNTLAFENFFHQVGQGKTSDAENMLETGVYGLPQGSVFTTLGSDNTFQAAPAILNQQGGYSSAVFHGNVGSFWNRNNVYKNFGYQNFFDASYFNTSEDNSLQYGLKDKLLFNDSIQYLEQLQQPFYAKFITVTNHFPFPLTKTDGNFPSAGTSSQVVNGYFQTAHYLDQAVKEFFDYLKASGLYQNSMIVLYGDHYGISNSDNPTLAPLIGKDSATWSDYDDAQMQRVPFMVNMPGLKGGIQKQYGGEIDVLPTILHLAGINTQGYIQFGTDLLSSQHDQTVAFRNNNFVTPTNTVLGGTIYDNSTGLAVTNPDASLIKKINQEQKKVDNELSLSDTVNNKNLLRFYTPAGFTPVDPEQYNYKNSEQRLIQQRSALGVNSTSLYSRFGNKSTTDLYQTDAPELKNLKQEKNQSSTNPATN